MQTVTLEEAQARLPELIASLPAEHEIVITRGGETVARIAAASATPATGSIFSLPTFPGKVLKPRFDRAEVWDELVARRG